MKVTNVERMLVDVPFTPAPTTDYHPERVYRFTTGRSLELCKVTTDTGHYRLG